MDARVRWLRGGAGAELASVEWGGEDLLVGAAADGTCRLWDLRSGRAERCVLAPTSANHAVARGQDVLVAAGKAVHLFDLRREETVLREWAVALEDGGLDEVNEIDAHADGEHVAVCDDAGQVAVARLSGARPVETVFSRRAHENICLTARFRPGQDWSHLASGGFDCRLCSWDAGKGKPRHKPLAVTASGAADAATQTGVQAINPPFVNSLSYSPDGAFMAAALGDSTVSVARGTMPTRAVTRFVAHAGSVCQCVALQPSAGTLGLLTTSNDQTARWWLLDVRDGIKPGQKPKLQWHLPLKAKANRLAASTSAAGTLRVAVAMVGESGPMVFET